jgi:hypothetical protein
VTAVKTGAVVEAVRPSQNAEVIGVAELFSDGNYEITTF